MTTTTETPMPERRAGPPARRRGLRVVLVAIVVLVLAVVAFLVFQLVVQPDEPSSFYDPPSTLPDGPPGTIVRDEPITDTSGVDVTRVLYTSTAEDGSPIAVSGVVGVPAGSPPAGGWPVIAWAHGTTGIASRCAPSLDADGGVARIPGFDDLVADGNVVVATDYVGLGTPGPHPYLVGVSEGRAVLDSVRAARVLLPGAVGDDTVVYGHSQGAHAALFAAALAPTYAPELRVLGTAAMAPPTDLAALMERDIGEPPGILLTALAVSSWSRLYPDAHEDEIVHTVARPFVADVGADCVLESTEGELAELPDIVALKLSFLSRRPADVPAWATLLRTNSPGPAPLTTPVLVAQGLADVMVRPDITATYVQAQCATGASIQFDTYPGVGHFQLRTVAAPDVIAWLGDRLTGTPATPGCTTNVKS